VAFVWIDDVLDIDVAAAELVHDLVGFDLRDARVASVLDDHQLISRLSGGPDLQLSPLVRRLQRGILASLREDRGPHLSCAR
jgi:hypothetical protein